MRTRASWKVAGLVAILGAVGATNSAHAAQPLLEQSIPSERVYQFDLSGPRLGGTLTPDGDAIAQFGWHFESQASPSPRGPWFIVERVFLIGGLERNAFVPNGTLVFGMRLPNSFEFGLGPSVTLSTQRGVNAGLVGAIGQSFRAGGIRIPVNLAVAAERGGEVRWTLLTGWAIRDRVTSPAEEERESRGGI